MNPVYLTTVDNGHPMLTDIKEHIEQDMERVLTEIKQITQSQVDLVNTIGSYALEQPGRKMVRPMILLLMARAFGYSGVQHISLAAIIEMIHSATLLHDDVIDHATTRRNKATTQHIYGGTQSILMGDFIYACAFGLIADLNSTQLTKILAQATKQIVEGEVQQLSQQRSLDTTIEEYFSIIEGKTAKLFSTGTHCITHLCQQTNHPAQHYGHHFGMIYQITDDILDVNINNTHLNKAHGTDLIEGKMTLPTILAYQHASELDRLIIKDVVLGSKPWQEVLPILDKTQAFSRCQPYIQTHLDAGINTLSSIPDSKEKQYLIALLHQVPQRNH